MTTNLALDEELVEEARLLGGHRSKKEAVKAALLEYVKVRQRRKLV